MFYNNQKLNKVLAEINEKRCLYVEKTGKEPNMVYIPSGKLPLEYKEREVATICGLRVRITYHDIIEVGHILNPELKICQRCGKEVENLWKIKSEGYTKAVISIVCKECKEDITEFIIHTGR